MKWLQRCRSFRSRTTDGNGFHQLEIQFWINSQNPLLVLEVHRTLAGNPQTLWWIQNKLHQKLEKHTTLWPPVCQLVQQRLPKSPTYHTKLYQMQKQIKNLYNFQQFLLDDYELAEGENEEGVRPRGWQHYFHQLHHIAAQLRECCTHWINLEAAWGEFESLEHLYKKSDALKVLLFALSYKLNQRRVCSIP